MNKVKTMTGEILMGSRVSFKVFSLSSFVTALVIPFLVGGLTEPAMAVSLHPDEHKISWGDTSGSLSSSKPFPVKLGPFDGVSIDFTFLFDIPAPPSTDSHSHPYLHSQLETIKLKPTFRNILGGPAPDTLNVTVFEADAPRTVFATTSGTTTIYSMSTIFTAPGTVSISGKLQLSDLGNSGAVVIDDIQAFASGTHHYAVPEPLTILGATTAVGFGTAFKRRLAKATKENKSS